MWLLQTLVYCAGVVVLLLAGVFCLATGLYTVAEWLEDHVKTTRHLIKRGTLCCASLQLLWLLCDRQLFWPNAIGLVSHANSWVMLQRYYPAHMGMDQPPTLIALALLVVHQTSWVLTWSHDAGTLLEVAAILAVVVWPIPIMLLLSAGTESDLPVRMPLGAGAGISNGLDSSHKQQGSMPSSPLAVSSQPGSPFVDTARLRMRHGLQPRGSSVDAGGGRLSTDTAHQPDQAAAGAGGFLSSMHIRKGSGGSEGSFSSGISAAWGLAERLQQQQGFKKHRSRFVQAMHKLQEAAGMQPAASVLPVAVDAHKR